jgi:hypothetical protein
VRHLVPWGVFRNAMAVPMSQTKIASAGVLDL